MSKIFAFKKLPEPRGAAGGRQNPGAAPSVQNHGTACLRDHVLADELLSGLCGDLSPSPAASGVKQLLLMSSPWGLISQQQASVPPAA